jgi:hypothetical protein
MKQAPTFLNFMDIPHSKEHLLPTLHFNHALNEWAQHRGHELQGVRPPNYGYYAPQARSTVAQCLAGHDALFAQEITHDNPQNLKFKELGDYPARVLSQIAYELGWRIVPLARWVAHKTGNQALANYVEVHCRQWCVEADLGFRTLQGEKITRNNALSQKATIQPLRKRATQLMEAVDHELGKYQM